MGFAISSLIVHIKQPDSQTAAQPSHWLTGIGRVHQQNGLFGCICTTSEGASDHFPCLTCGASRTGRT
jgi:hypothetical protein